MSACLSDIFTQEKNLCDFLFASMDDKTVLKGGLNQSFEILL